MADSPIFGTAGGFRAWDQDQAELLQRAAQTRLINAQIPNQMALTGYHNAQTEELRGKAELQRRKIAALDKIAAEDQAASGPQSPLAQAGSSGATPVINAIGDQFDATAEALRKRGERYLRTGALDEEATKLLKAASTLHQQSTGAQANVALASRRKIETEIKFAERMGEVFAGVTDEESYKNAVELWMKDPILSQKELPNGLRAYSPARIKQVLAGTKAFVEQRRLQMTEEDNASKERMRRSTQSLQRVQEAVMEGRLDVARDAEARRQRNGGAPNREASDDFRRFAERTFRERGYSFSPTVAQAHAYRLTDRANQMVQRNPALTRELALERAIQESIDAGEMDAAPTPRRLGGYGPKPEDTVRTPTPAPRAASAPAPGTPPAAAPATSAPRKFEPVPAGAGQWTAKPPQAALPPKSRKDVVPFQPYWDPKSGGMFYVDDEGKAEWFPPGYKLPNLTNGKVSQIVGGDLFAGADEDEEDDNG